MMVASLTKILVVDDEPDLASLVRQKFRRQIRDGVFAFTMAADGVEALDLLEADPGIEIVLTDINMPRMDGLTLLSHIAKKDRLLQAVVVSAYGDLDNIRMAMNRGSFDFLMKPIDLSDLENTIRRAKDTVDELKRAAMVRETFGRYLSDEVAATLLSNPDALKLGGEKRKVTIMMSDLRGFSNISELLEPESVVDILNIYLGKMADVITSYSGTIDEYIGDAILVTFGAPLQAEDDAERAVACALDMQCAMQGVNVALQERGYPVLEMGIGINTGEVVVGSFGSMTRAKYGVVGSHVNLTSRIETYTVGGQVLISENTYQEIRGSVRIGKQMKVSMKGFAEPTNIYEVEGMFGTYSIELPTVEEVVVPLARALSVEFNVLDGKHLSSKKIVGSMTALSSSSAHMTSDIPLELLDNLRIEFPLPQGNAGDVYAKVVETDSDEKTSRIRFTLVPQEIADVIRQLVG